MMTKHPCMATFLDADQADTPQTQGLTLVFVDEGTRDEMADKYHRVDCTLVPGNRLVPAKAYEWFVFRSVTMSQNHAQHIANFVNDHDDGTAQPRACAAQRGAHWLVEIKSTDVTNEGDLVVVTDLACSLHEAKAILGY